jgi:AcrR family transcriptional regulator
MSSRAAQAEQTRQQILSTARRLLAEHGYEDTTLQMIADEMGVTKAAVYYYFRAKSDILQAALRPGMERIEALLAEAAQIRSRRARTEHLVAGFVDFLVDYRNYSVMASLDPDATARKRDDKGHGHGGKLAECASYLFFGDAPTASQRVAFHSLMAIPDALADLADLSDDQLRDALSTSIRWILRVPA